MSTHHIERRRIRPVGRRIELRRIMSLLAVLIGLFAVAFGVGHIRRPSNTIVERTPPRLPVVATPLAAALQSAPAIKLAIAKPPPRKPSRPAPASITPVAPVVPAASAPAASAPTPTPAPTPAPVSPPPSRRAAPAPSTPSSGGSSHPAPKPSGGSGSGTSFESSG